MWTNDEKRKAKYDYSLKNIITSSLNLDELFWVSQCNYEKNVWDVFEVTHEGTSDVKIARKHMLIQEYELFRMQPGEPIVDAQKRFPHFVNHLISLGKEFDKEELNIKVLSALIQVGSLDLQQSQNPKISLPLPLPRCLVS